MPAILPQVAMPSLANATTPEAPPSTKVPPPQPSQGGFSSALQLASRWQDDAKDKVTVINPNTGNLGKGFSSTNTIVVPNERSLPMIMRDQRSVKLSASTSPLGMKKSSLKLSASIPTGTSLSTSFENLPQEICVVPCNMRNNPAITEVPASLPPESSVQTLPSQFAPISQSIAANTELLAFSTATAQLPRPTSEVSIATSLGTSAGSVPSLIENANNTTSFPPAVASSALTHDSWLNGNIGDLPTNSAAPSLLSDFPPPMIADGQKPSSRATSSFSPPVVENPPILRSTSSDRTYADDAPRTPVNQSPSMDVGDEKRSVAGSIISLNIDSHFLPSTDTTVKTLFVNQTDLNSKVVSQPSRTATTSQSNAEPISRNLPGSNGATVGSSNQQAAAEPAGRIPAGLTAADTTSDAISSLSRTHDAPSSFVVPKGALLPADATGGALAIMPGNAPNPMLPNASSTNLVSPNSASPNAPSTSAPIAAALASAAASPLAQTGTVQGARLMQGLGQSEMHIDLNTRAFGNVEVHTLVRDSQVGLSIGSEHGDLRSWLMPEVAGLQAILKRQDLQFDNMTFLGSNLANPGGGDGSAAGHSSRHLPVMRVLTEEPNSEAGLVQEAIVTPNLRGLNIHA